MFPCVGARGSERVPPKAYKENLSFLFLALTTLVLILSIFIHWVIYTSLSTEPTI